MEINKTVKKDGSPLKIAMIGGARTGKDTVANYLESVTDFKRVAFGDAMKNMLYKTFPDLPTDPKPREAMIKFGQACRDIDPLVWIKQADIEVKKWESFGYSNLIFTDVRQPNELNYCIANGYTIIKIVSRPEIQRKRASMSGESLDVNNEMDRYALEFEGYDYLIDNNGTLLELYEQVDEILREV